MTVQGASPPSQTWRHARSDTSGGQALYILSVDESYLFSPRFSFLPILAIGVVDFTARYPDRVHARSAGYMSARLPSKSGGFASTSDATPRQPWPSPRPDGSTKTPPEDFERRPAQKGLLGQ